MKAAVLVGHTSSSSQTGWHTEPFNVKRLLLLLPLLLSTAAAYSKEIHLNCKGEVDLSAIKGLEEGIQHIKTNFELTGNTTRSHEITIDKNSKLAEVSWADNESIRHEKIPFTAQPSIYVIETEDNSNPYLYQRKQHQIDKTGGRYKFIWRVTDKEDGKLIWETPFVGECTSQEQ